LRKHNFFCRALSFLLTTAAKLQGGSDEFEQSLGVVDLGPVASRALVLIHELLDRGAQADDRGAAQVLGRCVQTIFRGAACERRRYLIVVPRPMPAAPLRYLFMVPRPMLAAPRRYLIVMPRP
jgi:hypothetical protein